ncbi:MAG TPA: FAD-dependent oxidoreductase [Baekduia sp.]|jgi:2,4-dienoyl-CoA reductase (NADPH2)|nr:FAD-dependent oxidoreductase [Baekduia sp.]
MMSGPYPRLSSAFTLGSLPLRNRMVMLPVTPRYAVGGMPTERDLAFYGARARGGLGLVITGGTPVAPSSTMADRRLYEAYTIEALPGFRRLVDTVHDGGARIIGQIMHLGRELAATDTDWDVVAPSAVPSPASGQRQVPHAMTRAEIAGMVEQQARCAENLISVGYDGIELHAAHGYLGAEFLSPFSNRREDEYGGSIEDRMRFLLETVAAVRARCGDGVVLGVRMSAEEGVEGGLHPADVAEIGRRLSALGSVDYLSITTGIKGTYVPEIGTPHGLAAPAAGIVRAAVDIPVLVAQRITEPGTAEAILAEGSADLIGMGRGFIADPEWVVKAVSGRANQIRVCTGCMQECRFAVGGIACMNNATAGRELTLAPAVATADHPRRVVVVGGGPGGLEAAVVAAEAGHDVVLFEAADVLGGQARLAALAPRREELAGVVAPRVVDVERLGVDVRLGVRADAELVLAQEPDAVILATGATAERVALPGGDLPHVRTVVELLEEGVPDGARTAVVLDDGYGFWETYGTVELLAARGLAVQLVTPAQVVGAGVPGESVPFLLRRLAAAGVVCHRVTRAVSIDEDGVVVAGVYDEVQQRLPADLVVGSMGKRACDELAVALEHRVAALASVGDCVAPRRTAHAILEGHRAARALDAALTPTAQVSTIR